MRLNKKGFTLVELLAVIAILAILVVIAVPAVLDLFNNSRKTAFVTQAQSIYKAAEQEYMSKQISNVNISRFASMQEGSTLSLNGTADIAYCIKFTSGKISSISVSNSDFSITKTEATTGAGVSISDITESILKNKSENNGYAAVTTCN